MLVYMLQLCLLFWWFTCSIHSILPLLHWLWFTCSWWKTRQRMQQVAFWHLKVIVGSWHATSRRHFLRLVAWNAKVGALHVSTALVLLKWASSRKRVLLGAQARNKQPETDRWLEKHWGLHIYASSKLDFERTRTANKFGLCMTLLYLSQWMCAASPIWYKQFVSWFSTLRSYNSCVDSLGSWRT